MAEPRGVCIIAEINAAGNPTPLTLELVGLGRELAAGLGENIDAVLIGKDGAGAATELARYVSGVVYVLEDDRLSSYNPDTYLLSLTGLFQAHMPRVILEGHTCIGLDLAPRLAFMLEAGLVTDCVGIALDEGGEVISFRKPVFGGNALADLKARSRTSMATVRARVGGPPPPLETPGQVLPYDVGILDEPRITIRDKNLTDRECALEDALVVVSGGRGMGGQEGFAMLKKLADILGGAVGASRPPVDSGWASSTCQVGITGKVVAPDVYIAVAISGSSQHLSGMGESGKIVAINKDPEAYIFKVSDYGVVGDWRQVLPAFAAGIEGLLSD